MVVTFPRIYGNLVVVLVVRLDRVCNDPGIFLDRTYIILS